MVTADALGEEKGQTRRWALKHHPGTCLLPVQLQTVSFLRFTRLCLESGEITVRGAKWKVSSVQTLMNQISEEQLGCSSSAPGAQPPSTCKVGYLLGEAAVVLSQPGSFYRNVWRKVAFKWKEKGTAGRGGWGLWISGKPEADLEAALPASAGTPEFRAQECLWIKQTQEQKDPNNLRKCT